MRGANCYARGTHTRVIKLLLSIEPRHRVALRTPLPSPRISMKKLDVGY